MKEYSELKDVEKYWLHEYKSWCKCAKNNSELYNYAMTQIEIYKKFLSEAGINICNFA